MRRIIPIISLLLIFQISFGQDITKQNARKKKIEEEIAYIDKRLNNTKNKQKKKLRNPHKTFDPLLKRKWLPPLESREKASPYRVPQGRVALLLPKLWAVQQEGPCSPQGDWQVPRGHSQPAILPASPSAVALGQLERQE